MLGIQIRKLAESIKIQSQSTNRRRLVLLSSDFFSFKARIYLCFIGIGGHWKTSWPRSSTVLRLLSRFLYYSSYSWVFLHFSVPKYLGENFPFEGKGALDIEWVDPEAILTPLALACSRCFRYIKRPAFVEVIARPLIVILLLLYFVLSWFLYLGFDYYIIL